MKFSSVRASSFVVGMGFTFVTIVAGASSLLAADQGAPGWVQVPLLAWLLTFGLPTTLGVLAVAAAWGTPSPLFGLVGFAVSALVLATLLQVGTTHLIRSQRRAAK